MQISFIQLQNTIPVCSKGTKDSSALHSGNSITWKQIKLAVCTNVSLFFLYRKTCILLCLKLLSFICDQFKGRMKPQFTYYYNHSARQEAPFVLLNQGVYYCVQNNPPALQPCVIFCDMLCSCGEKLFAPTQPLSWMTILYWLSIIAYSVVTRNPFYMAFSVLQVQNINLY